MLICDVSKSRPVKSERIDVRSVFGLVLYHSPSGWDNEKKISILHENFQTVKADDSFEEVIVKPPVRKVQLHFHSSHCTVLSTFIIIIIVK